MKFVLLFPVLMLSLLAGCTISSLIQDVPDGGNPPASTESVLSVESIVYSGTNSVSTYDVLGYGPGDGRIQKYDLVETNCRFDHLEAGLWAVIVYARDASGKIVASGFAQANLEAGKTTAVSVILSDASDAGTLVISVSWPFVPNDSLLASLFSNSAEYPLAMTEGSDGQSASYVDTRIGAGSYDLKLTLKCDSTNLWSVFPAFSILPGEITFIRYQLTTDDIGIQFSRNYLIYGDTIPYQNKFLFDRDGHLYVWNNLTIVDSSDAGEGDVAYDLSTPYVAWWGMGISHEVPGPKDLSMYTQGTLRFSMKTTSEASFKVGIKNSTTEYWLTLYPYDRRFGLIRDGQWHDVSIPFACFGSPDMSSVNQLFMIADSTPTALFSAKLDAIYYAWEPANMNVTNMTTNNFRLLTNVAYQTFANQSSLAYPGSTLYYPVFAVDNNFTKPAITMADTNAWWETDLGRVRYIHTVKVKDGGTGDSELNHFYLFISENPFQSSDLDITKNQPGVAKYYFSDKAGLTNGFEVGKLGRYVRIQRTEVKQLYLLEVEVFDYYARVANDLLPDEISNAALNTIPNQSSLAYPGSTLYYPVYAVDNNFSRPAITMPDTNAWWETDLGSVKTVDSVRLYQYNNSMPLRNFYVFVSENPFSSSDLDMTKNQPGVTKIFITNDAGVAKTVAAGVQGRYVRIQRTDTNGLCLTEVQIMIPSSEISAPPSLTNASLNTIPNQSSLAYPGSTLYYPVYAVDNNFSRPAITMPDTNAWWETDLGSVKTVDSVRLYQYNNGMPLRNFYIFVSENPFSSSDLNMTKNQPGVTKIFITNDAGVAKTVGVGVAGRYVRIQRTDTNGLCLTEAQIMIPSAEITAPPSLTNAAWGTIPNQSSLAYPGSTLYYPVYGVDNDFSKPAITVQDTNAWWETDLGSVRNIDSVRLYLYNNSMPLRNFYIFVSENPFSSSDLDMTKNQSGVTKIFITNNAGVVKTVGVGLSGRYVRIQRTDTNGLYLNEAQIMIPSSEITALPTLVNVALGTTATQCSIAYPGSTLYYPAYAVDNNFSRPAITMPDTNAWWETDLGSVRNIDSVRTYLYNNNMPLRNFYIFVSENPFSSSDLDMTKNQPGVTGIFITNDAGVVKTVGVGVAGRHVRIQRTDTNGLYLTEVQVLEP